MLRRSAFKRPVYTPPPRAPLGRVTRQCVSGAAEMREPIEKECVVQHSGYMDFVRSLPCIRCGRPPRSQFCHSDQGKGLAIKTDCRRGWPGCAACHYLIGSTGTFTRDQRRVMEDRYSKRTRELVILAGMWPARLPRWTE